MIQQNRMPKQESHEGSDGGMRETLEQVWTKPQEVVTEYPLSSVLFAFGIGLAAGVAVATLLSEPAPYSQRFTSQAEKFGRQMLDAIAGVLPESVLQRFQGQA